MTYNRWILYCSCVFIVLSLNIGISAGKTFKIAFLAPSPASKYRINAGNSVNGLKLALRSVLKNPSILSGRKLTIKYFETACHAQSAVTTAMMAKRTYNPDVIVGPPCREGLKMVAQLGTFWNLPVLSWYHTGAEFNSAKKYPTLVRLTPPLHSLSQSLVQILIQNNWRHVSLLYSGQEPWALLEDPIREGVVRAGLEMHGVYKVTSNMAVTALRHMYTHIRRIAQAVIMVCPFDDIRHYMLTASSVGMTNGRYAFIHLDPEIYSNTDLNAKILSNGGWKRGDMVDSHARKAYESVIHVLFDPMTEKAGQVSLYPGSMYTEYSTLATNEAKFKHLEWDLPTGVKPDVYSAYLCDAVVVWSALADMIQKHGKDHRDGKLMAKYMRRISTEGATGHVALSENLDRLAEVFVLDMQDDGNFKPVQLYKFNKTDGFAVTNIEPAYQRFNKSLTNVLVHVPHSHAPTGHMSGHVHPTLITLGTTTTLAPTVKPMLKSKFKPSANLESGLKATEAAIKRTRKQITETAHKYETINKPTRLAGVKAVKKARPKVKVKAVKKARPKVDPFLNNFEVRIKKKRRIYTKAKKYLKQINQTVDPNVAAFLRIALERLNRDEELMPATRREMPDVPRRMIKKPGNIKKKRKVQRKILPRKIKRKPVVPTVGPEPITVTEAETTTLPTTVPAPTQGKSNVKTTVPPTTVLVTKKLAKANTSPAITAIKNQITKSYKLSTTTSKLPVKRTRISKTIKIKTTTSPKATTEVPTTYVPTTAMFFDETTTQPVITTTKKRIPKRRRKPKRKPRRRGGLRRKWVHDAPPTVLYVPTTEAPEPPDVDPMMAENMVSSLVNKVTKQLMSKVNGEIQNLKNSIKTMQSTNSKKPKQPNTAKNTHFKDVNKIIQPKTDKKTTKHTTTKIPASADIVPTTDATPPAQKVDQREATVSKATKKAATQTNNSDMKQALIEEIKANVLTKLKGVSWLQSEQNVPQPKPKSQALSGVIDKTSSETKKVVVESTTEPPTPPTVRTTTIKHVTPIMVGNWKSGLPPGLSMQMFAMETVPDKKKNIAGVAKTSVAPIKNPTKKPIRSTRNNPLNLQMTTPAAPQKNLASIPKLAERPVTKEDLFKGSSTGILEAAKSNAVPIPKQVKRADKQHAVKSKSINQQEQVKSPNMDTMISSITDSVVSEVNKKIDQMKRQLALATTTPEPVKSLRQKFQSTVSSDKTSVQDGYKMTGNFKNDIVKQISEAVIQQLNGYENGKAPNHAANIVQPQKPQPEMRPASVNLNSNVNLADTIASKVFSRVNAKLDALSQSVNHMKRESSKLKKEATRLKQEASRQEYLEDIAPMMAQHSPMMQPFGHMPPGMPPGMYPGMPPNMPPMGMYGRPPSPPSSSSSSYPKAKPIENPLEIVDPPKSTNSATKKPPNGSSDPATASNTKPKTMTVTFDLNKMGQMPPWMAPQMNPWMNMGMPNQQMWGQPRQTRAPWWE